MTSQGSQSDATIDIAQLESGGPPEAVAGDDGFGALARWMHGILDPICKYLCYAAAIVTLLMSIGMVVDLVSRLAFGRPLSGMIELQTYMLVFMAFFSIAYTMLKNQHVSVDLLTSVMSAQTNSTLQSIFSIWGTFLFGAMSWLSATRAAEAFRRDEISDIIQMPFWILYAVVAIGTLLLALTLLAALFTHLSGLFQAARGTSQFWMRLGMIVLVALVGMFSGLILKSVAPDLSSPTIGILYTVFLMIILLLGFPVGFSMAFAGLTGLFYLIGSDVAFNVTKINTYDAVGGLFLLRNPVSFCSWDF